MKWYCVANPIGNKYCDGTPDWEKEPRESGAGFFGTGTCKLNPETCGRCKTSQQLWDELPQEEKDRISKSSYVETIIPIEKPKVEGKKPKSKKAQKLEEEMAQRSMF